MALPAGGDPVAARLDLAPGEAAPPVFEPVHATDAVRIGRDGERFALRSGTSWLLVDTAAARGRGRLEDDFWRRDRYAQREFFLTALVMLLRASERYGLHASAVANEAGGALLVGASGSGKTTLMLALLAVGWSLVADDAVALLRSDARAEIAPLRRGASLTAATDAAFPELARAPEMYRARDKRVRDLAALPGVGSVPGAPVRALLFPAIAERERTLVEPLRTVDAIVGLARQSAGILTPGAASARQLELLRALTAQTRPLRLLLGRDLLADPRAVAARLAPSLAAAGS